MVHDRLDSVSLFMRQAADHDILTKKEEYELTTAYQKGCKEAREIMLTHNQRLVVNLSTRFQHFGIPLLDLVQEGNLGLMKALDKFEPELGYKFATYATYWIRHYIERLISNQRRSVRLPVHVEEKLRKIKKVSEEIEEANGRTATNEEIAARLGVSEKRIETLKRYGQPSFSLDTPLSDESDSKTIGDLIGTDDKNYYGQKELAQAIESVLDDLTPREAKIITLRYGLQGTRPHTLEEVGAKYNLTRERIRQIEKEAMSRLRHPSRTRQLRTFLTNPS